MKNLLLVSLAVTAALAGCASPEVQLRRGLINAGLPNRMADCMAHRMTERLSLTELRRIGDLPHAADAPSVGVFLHRMRALGDDHIVTVTTTSAGLCAVGLG